MQVLEMPFRILMAVNTAILRIGRHLAWMALACMVIAILLQVFWRYVLGSGLNWSEELARFLMLWMTGLIAPSAYRWGGFVAIDMLPRALGRVPGLLLNLAILAVSLCVLIMAVRIGYSDVTGFGGRGNSASLRVPLSLFGGEDIKFKNWAMMLSLFTGMALMLSVNIELTLRTIINLFSPGTQLPEDGDMIAAGAD